MKFLVVSSAPTLKAGNKLTAYSPYVKEMDVWFRKVEEVVIVSPMEYPDNVFVAPFERQDLEIVKLPLLIFKNSLQTFFSICKIPFLILKLFHALFWADHIHLRCPGNISLIACFLQVFFPKKPKTVKYAGNWDPEAKQPWSYKLQKKILSNTFLSKNVKVLVYGNWPNQSVNIVPFFTASFSESEKVQINKEFATPFKFLFVGSLVAGKNPLYAIKLIEALMAKAIPVTLDLYGDGILKKELEEYAEQKKLDPFVTFHGNIPLEEVKVAYKNSHFLILASQSEGWPKAVAEGMFFGCVPIATAVSCVPWMLGGGSRGILIPEKEYTRVKREKRGEKGVVREQRTEDRIKVIAGRGKSSKRRMDNLDVLDETAERVVELINDPEEMKRMSSAAQEWSQEYTLEKFEEAIIKVLKV